MLKKIKYFMFILIVSVFVILSCRYYFSDINKKNSFRSLSNNDQKITMYSKNLPILKDDTKNIIEYVEQSINKKKKKFNFWKLLDSNE